MIEQSIYFALGCIVTALLALLFAPVFWRRALRLTRQRLQLQVPLSMQEIFAERDQLRASFAVERLRIEQRIERILASKTKDLIEIGRRTMEAGGLADEVAALRRLEQAQQKEIDLLLRDAVEHGAEKSALSLALHETEEKVEEWRGKAEVAHDAHTRQHAEAEKGLVESLRGRLETAMTQSTRHETASLSLRRELDDAKARLRELERELADARKPERAGASPARAETSEGDKELRASIHALGVAVAQLARKSQKGGSPQKDGDPHQEGDVRSRPEIGATAGRPVGVA